MVTRVIMSLFAFQLETYTSRERITLLHSYVLFDARVFLSCCQYCMCCIYIELHVWTRYNMRDTPALGPVYSLAAREDPRSYQRKSITGALRRLIGQLLLLLCFSSLATAPIAHSIHLLLFSYTTTCIVYEESSTSRWRRKSPFSAPTCFRVSVRFAI